MELGRPVYCNFPETEWFDLTQAYGRGMEMKAQHCRTGLWLGYNLYYFWYRQYRVIEECIRKKERSQR